MQTPDRDESIGAFRAVVTCDGEGWARDGQPYFAMRRLTEVKPRAGDGALFEILFADGLWMLCRDDDLVSGRVGSF